MTDQLPTQIGPLGLDEMECFAQSMLRCLPTPLVIGLVGTLGAGKTTLVQAIARAVGVDAADVTSPTFTLLQSHAGSIQLHHLDAYRVADEDEFLELGVEELFEEEQAWTLIEWADRVADVLPEEALWIEFKIDREGDTRSITLTTRNQRLATALQQIGSDAKQRSNS